MCDLAGRRGGEGAEHKCDLAGCREGEGAAHMCDLAGRRGGSGGLPPTTHVVTRFRRKRTLSSLRCVPLSPQTGIFFVLASFAPAIRRRRAYSLCSLRSLARFARVLASLVRTHGKGKGVSAILRADMKPARLPSESTW
jgi:hypothetical protein